MGQSVEGGGRGCGPDRGRKPESRQPQELDIVTMLPTSLLQRCFGTKLILEGKQQGTV